jgi:hypothetical protein
MEHQKLLIRLRCISGPLGRASKIGDEDMPEFLPRANRIWAKVVEPGPCGVPEMQL